MDKKVAIATCAVFAFGAGMLLPSFADAQVETSFDDGYSPKKFSIEDCKPATYPWQEMGYTSIYEYSDDLADKQLEAEGMAEEAVAAYGNVITDEQRESLFSYEEQMKNAQSISTYDKNRDAFEQVVAECETAMSESTASMPVVQASAYDANGYNACETGGSACYANAGGNVNLRSAGVVNDGGHRYTWYSQNVLPGGGLNIPGRHVNADGFVCDGDGYIVCASAYGSGATGNSPWGAWKSYDTGVSGNTVDLYTSW